MAWEFYNPFAKHEAHSRSTLITHQVLTFLSWALVLVSGIYYSINEPDDVENGHTIWEQASSHDTPFSQNPIVTAIYWILLLLSQLSYIWHLFSKDVALVTAAANTASHFTLSNLFVFAFIMLWVRNHFWPAEVILAFHLLSQVHAYWIHLGVPDFIHLPTLAGPYAWTLTTLFWNGSVAVRSDSFSSGIAANIFIWIIFVVGIVHVFLVKDYLFGYALSLLSLSLAIRQFAIKIIDLQWIFAFVIFGVFFVGSLYISTVVYSKRDIFLKRTVVPETTDQEREPLLNNP